MGIAELSPARSPTSPTRPATARSPQPRWQGGTFTITNTGSRGALFDTPIIDQPQVDDPRHGRGGPAPGRGATTRTAPRARRGAVDGLPGAVLRPPAGRRRGRRPLPCPRSRHGWRPATSPTRWAAEQGASARSPSRAPAHSHRGRGAARSHRGPGARSLTSGSGRPLTQTGVGAPRRGGRVRDHRGRRRRAVDAARGRPSRRSPASGRGERRGTAVITAVGGTTGRAVGSAVGRRSQRS